MKNLFCLSGLVLLVLSTACSSNPIIEPRYMEATLQSNSRVVGGYPLKLELTANAIAHGFVPSSVDFYLDGQPVAMDSTAPFSQTLQIPFKKDQEGKNTYVYQYKVVAHTKDNQRVVHDQILDLTPEATSALQKFDTAGLELLKECVNVVKKHLDEPPYSLPTTTSCATLLGKPLPVEVTSATITYGVNNEFMGAVSLYTGSEYHYNSTTDDYTYFKAW